MDDMEASRRTVASYVSDAARVEHMIRSACETVRHQMIGPLDKILPTWTRTLESQQELIQLMVNTIPEAKEWASDRKTKRKSSNKDQGRTPKKFKRNTHRSTPRSHEDAPQPTSLEEHKKVVDAAAVQRWLDTEQARRRVDLRDL